MRNVEVWGIGWHDFQKNQKRERGRVSGLCPRWSRSKGCVECGIESVLPIPAVNNAVDTLAGLGEWEQVVPRRLASLERTLLSCNNDSASEIPLFPCPMTEMVVSSPSYPKATLYKEEKC